uniref:transmembrane protein 198-like n=1 Tax=Myxine glutinosa TaxID=7769 RepID=UPI00358EB11A
MDDWGDVGAWRDCNEDPERAYQAVPAAICATSCLFGVIYCFFGYRCFKAVMFLTGLLFGSALIFLLCYKERVLDTELSLEASAGIALAIGLLCGLVTMLVRTVGLFTTGLQLGLLLAAASLILAEPFYRPSSAWVPLGLLLGTGMLFAVLTLQWPRPFVVLSTAVFGAMIITAALDYFVEMLQLARHAHERLRVHSETASAHAAPTAPLPCWYSWAVLATWPALSLLGIAIQCRVTSERASRAEVIIRHRHKRVHTMRVRQQRQPRPSKRQRRAPEGIYRRKPCPMRRFNADVLPPSYIQSIREQQQDSSPSGPLETHPPPSDSHYDCSSMVPLTCASSSSHA